VGDMSRQFSAWSRTPRGLLISGIIFVVFLVLALLRGDWLNALVWVAFLAGTGLSYASGAISPSRPLARKIASVAAAICVVGAALLALYVGFFGRS
jgi:hypothetical protein